MLERHLMLNAAVAVLLGCLAWLHPGLGRRLGRPGLALYVAGALLPFLDTALFHVITADRIELLSRPPLFAAPVYALALIGAVAVLAALAGPLPGVTARAVRIALLLAAGFAAHVGLAVLTPVGWPLLAPFLAQRMALPVLPTGHLPLLAVLLAGLVAAEGLRRWRRWIAPGVAMLAVAYGLAGAVQYALVAWPVRNHAPPGGHVHVYPDNPWLTRWQVVVEGPERYALWRQRAGAGEWPEPRTLPRWNDQALFLKLLGDPVVNRFYYRVFQHPVVRLDVSGSQITLLMQELQDQSPLVPGPTFYLESDLTGRNRFYQLQRFN